MGEDHSLSLLHLSKDLQWNAGLAFLLGSLVSEVDNSGNLCVLVYHPGAFVLEAVGLFLFLGNFHALPVKSHMDPKNLFP